MMSLRLKALLCTLALGLSGPIAITATPAAAQDWIGNKLDRDQFERLRKHNVARHRAKTSGTARWNRHVRACKRAYSSYNPRTDHYQVRRGVTRRCRL